MLPAKQNYTRFAKVMSSKVFAQEAWLAANFYEQREVSPTFLV
jgi:hypothetical protein